MFIETLPKKANAHEELIERLKSHFDKWGVQSPLEFVSFGTTAFIFRDANGLIVRVGPPQDYFLADLYRKAPCVPVNFSEDIVSFYDGYGISYSYSVLVREDIEDIWDNDDEAHVMAEICEAVHFVVHSLFNLDPDELGYDISTVIDMIDGNSYEKLSALIDELIEKHNIEISNGDATDEEEQKIYDIQRIERKIQFLLKNIQFSGLAIELFEMMKSFYNNTGYVFSDLSIENIGLLNDEIVIRDVYAKPFTQEFRDAEFNAMVNEAVRNVKDGISYLRLNENTTSLCVQCRV